MQLRKIKTFSFQSLKLEPLRIDKEFTLEDIVANLTEEKTK